jgi:starch synthase
LCDIAEKLLDKDVQLIILGEGDADIVASLQELVEKYPGKVAFNNTFDELLAHQIEAGADMYLMPSLFEPCGLNQMYSCMYGTVPIVRATGGLQDTVKQFDEETGQGNGFLFDDFSGEALLEAIETALELFNNKNQWLKVIENGMNTDFSWTKSSGQYQRVYCQVLGIEDEELNEELDEVDSAFA